MLESLEKLRGGPVYGVSKRDACHLADEIQAEVDEKYIPRDQAYPRPLFEGGEPVQWGDKIAKGDVWMESPVDEITYYSDGTVEIRGGGNGLWFGPGEHPSRPPEPDTQEKIDDDLTLAARDYCNKRGLNADYDSDMAVEYYPEIVTRMDLLARQRKLDGVE